MAHLLEHMVFKGTPSFENVPKALRDHGARFNGSTWVDRTNYYETMPATDENLEFGIKLEADRLVNSYVKHEDLISEMTVVRNEFEMGENDPQHILSQRMMAVAYEWHNYGKSTIGNRTDIERVPIDNLQEFYRKYYQVDNAMLVIAGQFDEKKAARIRREILRFAQEARPCKLNNTYTEEPAQDGERLVVLRRVGTVGATGVVYHIPAGAHEDFAAVQVLEDCLTSKPAGRVYKSLVEGKKASSVTGTAFGWHDPGTIEITAKVEDPQGRRCRPRCSGLHTRGSEGQADHGGGSRAQQAAASKVQRANSGSQRRVRRPAQRVGGLPATGGSFFLHRDRVEKVTAKADVNRVAAKYLIRARTARWASTIPPRRQNGRASRRAPSLAKMLEGYKGRASLAAGESFDPTPANIEKRVVRGELGTLKTAYLAKKTRGEMVDVVLNLRYGKRRAARRPDHRGGVAARDDEPRHEQAHPTTDRRRVRQAQRTG